MAIEKAAVIGAGVMGASIAAHITNAGVPVVLLDIVPDGATNRNVISEGAVNKLLKAQPAAFMHKKNAKLITTGNIEDNLDLLADVDWIIEVVLERLDIKQNVYRKINSVRKVGSIVSSNTSTIPLGELTQGMPIDFCCDFLITHFFNPPRYMRLLELVAGKYTSPETLEAIRSFADLKLGKGVIDCKDTPGFIGNRIGIFWLQCGVVEAMAAGLTVEEADAVMGKPIGIPKTGVFGLLDLVGLDLMPHINESMGSNLPESDAFHGIKEIPDLISKMIDEGYTGRKGKGGFYRLNRSEGKKVKEAKNLNTGEYHPSKKPTLDSLTAAKSSGIRGLLEFNDKTGWYAWRVLSQTLTYAAHHAKEIAHDIVAIDSAMKSGYNWTYGPFELIDQLGVDWLVKKLEAEDMPVPEILQSGLSMYRIHEGNLQFLGFDSQYHNVERGSGVLLLSDIKLHNKPLAKNASSNLWDIGDGVLCLEFTSKMNSLDPQIMEMFGTAINIIPGKYKALVIHNEGENFCVGANLGLMLFGLNLAAWSELEGLLKQGQDVYKALKYVPFPVVAAPSAITLGGGCELLMHCDAVQAHAELYTGLVEVGVGIIPGWGGCKEMLFRWAENPRHPKGPMPSVTKAFELIGTATVSKSAADARDMQVLRESDDITMNKDRLLADAKAKALALSQDYSPPEPPEFSLPGLSGKTSLEMAVAGFHSQGKATDHDVVVSDALGYVLSGGDTDPIDTLSEDDVLALEREAFMGLVHHPDTMDRLEHMLNTGKPLRN